ncbi:MAG: prepilin peptidase [bacterium]
MIFYLTIFAFLFGLIIGSFINCLVWRLYKNESMMNRSYCPNCRKMISWYDNIPVISYLLLKAKCRKCLGKISCQYPLVEIITGILFALAFYINHAFSVQLFLNWLIIFVMIIIFIYDLRWYLILDIITLPACVIIFLLNIYIGISWQNLLLSGAIGGGFFLLQFIVSRGKWIGGGDIRLGLLMGFALGFPMILVAIFLAYIIGSVASLGLLASGKKQWSSKIPLGIFLSTATIITLFWGDKMLGWYLGYL